MKKKNELQPIQVQMFDIVCVTIAIAKDWLTNICFAKIDGE